MMRKFKEATKSQKENLIRMGFHPDRVGNMSLQEASHLISITIAANRLKSVRDAAKNFQVGDKVEYHSISCEVTSVRGIQPNSPYCNMNNITIRLPDGKKKTVQANSLKKVTVVP